MNDVLDNLKGIDLSVWWNWLKPIVHVLLVLVLARVAFRIAKKLIKLFQKRMGHGVHSAEEVRRVETLSGVFRYTAFVVIVVVAGTLALDALGLSVAPVLTAAGVVGLAVSFGAQSLVKDFFTGFFLLLENQVRVGDIVEAGGKTGLVEEVTLRYLRLRGYEGNVHFIPNSTIQAVTNRTRGFTEAVIDVGVEVQQDFGKIFETMRGVARDLRGDPVMGEKIIGDLEISGVNMLSDTALVLRCRFRVYPMETWPVRREFLRRLKIAFDERAITMPPSYRAMYSALLPDGPTPPAAEQHFDQW